MRACVAGWLARVGLVVLWRSIGLPRIVLRRAPMHIERPAQLRQVPMRSVRLRGETVRLLRSVETVRLVATVSVTLRRMRMRMLWRCKPLELRSELSG